MRNYWKTVFKAQPTTFVDFYTFLETKITNVLVTTAFPCNFRPHPFLESRPKPLKRENVKMSVERKTFGIWLRKRSLNNVELPGPQDYLTPFWLRKRNFGVPLVGYVIDM